MNNDDYIGFLTSNSEPIEFLSYDGSTRREYKTDSEAEIQLVLQLSANKYIYERNVYTFFKLIGDVGGFNGAIVIVPTFLMAIYSERMY